MSPVVFYSAAVLGVMGFALGLLLAIFGRVFAVSIDPRVEGVASALACLNCGVCGYPGCRALAEAIVAGKAKAEQCAPGGDEAVRKVAELLGQQAVFAEPSVAVVRCRGGRSVAKERAVYRGVRDCVSADLIGAGSKACEWGCLGMGSCAAHRVRGAADERGGTAGGERGEVHGVRHLRRGVPEADHRTHPAPADGLFGVRVEG